MLEYIESILGLFNVVHLLLDPMAFFLITMTYQRSKTVFLRLDTLAIVWVTGTFFVLSLLLLACGTLDPELAYTRVYRTTLMFASLYYAVATVGFVSHELSIGVTIVGRIAVTLVAVNCFSYIAAAVIAFQPAIL